MRGPGMTGQIVAKNPGYKGAYDQPFPKENQEIPFKYTGLSLKFELLGTILRHNNHEI